MIIRHTSVSMELQFAQGSMRVGAAQYVTNQGRGTVRVKTTPSALSHNPSLLLLVLQPTPRFAMNSIVVHASIRTSHCSVAIIVH